MDILSFLPLLVLVQAYFALVVGGLVYALDFALQPGQLLEGYARWLDTTLHGTPLYKPLGGCLVCTALWLGLLSGGASGVWLGLPPAAVYLQALVVAVWASAVFRQLMR